MSLPGLQPSLLSHFNLVCALFSATVSDEDSLESSSSAPSEASSRSASVVSSPALSRVASNASLAASQDGLTPVEIGGLSFSATSIFLPARVHLQFCDGQFRFSLPQKKGIVYFEPDLPLAALDPPPSPVKSRFWPHYWLYKGDKSITFPSFTPTSINLIEL